MKKIFVLMLIALMAITSVFAAETGANSSDTTAEGSAKTEVTLDLSSIDLEGYRLGFTPGDEDPSAIIDTDPYDLSLNVPDTHVGKIELVYDPSDATASGSGYFYYSLRSAQALTLTVSATHLGTTSLASNNTIKYTVSGLNSDKDTKTSFDSGTGSVIYEITPDPITGFAYGSSGFTITTTTINPNQKASDWTSTMTLTLASNS